MKEHDLICIGCPMGCNMHVTIDEEGVFTVTGNTCPNGERYAKTELTKPQRQVTSTVRVLGGALDVVPVKTAAPVPKEKIFDCVRAMKGLAVPAPVDLGQVLSENLADTGVDLIATKAVGRK